MKLRITFLIMCALFLGTVTGFGQGVISGQEIPIEGTNLKWIYTANDSTLTIRGTGDIPDRVRPWYDNDLVRSNTAKVVIEDGVTSIGEAVFEGLYNAYSITLAPSVKSLRNAAFWGCSKMSYINLNQVESIEDGVFAYWRLLTSITIPASVRTIKGGAFRYCEALSTINIAAGNTSYIVEDSVLYNTAKTLLLFYPNTKNVATFNVPLTVDTIGNGAFTANPYLTAVDIPESVKYIGTEAFNNCRALASVTIEEGLTYIGWYAFAYCSFASIDLPESLLDLGGYAFANNSKLTLLSIPANVRSIGGGVVANCTSLQSIEVDPANTYYVSIDDVVYNAYNPARTLLVMYPVGKGATSFEVPSGVTLIIDGAFAGDTALTSVTLPESVKQIGYSAFSSCTNLASIDLTNVETLGNYAFQNCGFTSLVIPGGLTTLPDGAFQNCQKLDSVTIQDGVTSIGNYAFGNSPNLKSVTLPNSVTTIGESAFTWCRNLNSINLPDGLTRIEAYTFSSAGLTSIDIPGSVEYIGLNAFAWCWNLKDVTVHWQNAIAPHISSFNEINYEAVLHVPTGTSASYEADAVWSGKFRIEEVEGLVVEENEPVVTGNEGSITLSLSIPANSTIVGSFNVILPSGMEIDINKSALVDELAAEYTLTITKIDGMNAWKFEISVRTDLTPAAAQAARLRTVSEITNILNIGFTVDETVADDDYEIQLTNFDVKLVDLETGDESDFTDIDANTVFTVEVPVTRTTVALVEITPGSLTGEVGGSAQLTVAVTAGDGVDKSVIWTTTNAAVATVTPTTATTATTATVRYIGAGEAKIIATATDGSLKADTIIVTVTEPTVPVDPDPIVVLVSSITIDKTSLTGVAGSTAQLSATVSPVNATDASVTWSSSNNAVATVDATGLVSFVAHGTATITATANDGSGVSSSITVTVTPQMSTEEAAAAAFALRPLNGAVQISGLTPGEPLSIYTTSGRLVYSGRAIANEQYVNVNVRGTLIVVAGKKTGKVILK